MAPVLKCVTACGACALQVLALVPLLMGVMWAEPAHAARKSRQVSHLTLAPISYQCLSLFLGNVSPTTQLLQDPSLQVCNAAGHA